MELKVWVEGIQRVICGVTDDTTCQDVVVALAHAIGKTGRFTLIERWKDTERLLSPTEQPLLSLHKWGEYASDVQFILRRTKSSPDKRNGQFSQHNFSPHFPELPQGSGSNIKKSLTFSGAHTSAAKSRRLDKRNAPENSSGESQKDLSSLTSFSSKSSSSPYSSLEKRPKPNLSPIVQSPSLSSTRSPNRTFTNTASSSTASLPNNENLVRTTPVGSPQKSNTVQNLASSQSSQSYVLDIHKNISKSSSRETSPNKLHHSTPSLLQKSRLEEYDLDKHLRPSSDRDLSKVNGDKVNGVRDLPEKVIEGTDKESLLQLIKEQQQQLENQESKIKSVDTEIQCWEDKENDYVQKSENIKSEVVKLQNQEVQLNLELRDLQLLESSFESEKKGEQKLKMEINVAKSRLSHSEKKLEDIRKKQGDIVKQLEDLRKEKDREVQDAKDREISMLQEMSKLQKEVNNKLKEHETQQESRMELSSEVKDLDAELSKRQNQLTSLEAELKETNMTEFLVLPADAVKEACETQGEKRNTNESVISNSTRKRSETDPSKSAEGYGSDAKQSSWTVGVKEAHGSPQSLPNRGRSSSLNNIGLSRQLQIAGEVDEASLRLELQMEQTFAKEQTKKPKKLSHRAFSETEIRDLRDKTPDLINGNDAELGDQPFTWQGKKIAAKPQFLYYL